VNPKKCICIAVAVALLALAGCAGEKQHRPSAESMQAARPAPARLAELTPQRLAQEKDDLAKAVKTRLGKLEKRMAELQTKAQAKGAQAEGDFEKIKADIDTKVATTNEEVSKAEAAAAETWESMKASVKAALRDAERTLKKARAQIEGAPQPAE